MTNLIVIPQDREMIAKASPFVSGFIIGVKGLSVNLSHIVDDYIGEVNYIKNLGKKVYVSLNKNMTNEDLFTLEKVLSDLTLLSIEGIFFYDIAVLSLNNRLKLNHKLIWNQEHFTTNFYTSNFFFENGVSGMHISSDITLNEINEIIEASKTNLFLTIFGYLPMFNSFRHLVNNYLDTFSIDKEKDLYYMEEKGKYYPIIDDEFGTRVYSEKILNGLSEFKSLKEKKVSFIFDSFLIDFDKFIDVLKLFNGSSFDDSLIEELFSNTDKGFFYKETIYRVKK